MPVRLATRIVPGPSGAVRLHDGAGAGVAVVFIHSLAGTLYQWGQQLGHLDGARRAVALDLPGHGGSAPPPGASLTLDRAAAAVAAVVDALELERVVLVGHSFGGGVAAVYAGAQPQQVAGILFVDPIGDQHQAANEMEEWLAELRKGDPRQGIRRHWEAILEGAKPATRERVLADLRATSDDVILTALDSTAAFDARAALAAWEGPMLSLVTPLNDYPFSLHNVVPGLRGQVIRGTSHWLQLDRPAAFEERLDRFLGQVGP